MTEHLKLAILGWPFIALPYIFKMIQSFKRFLLIVVTSFGLFSYLNGGTSELLIKWGTQSSSTASNSLIASGEYQASAASSIQLLKNLHANGELDTINPLNGHLIELGFFDKLDDGTIDATYQPNTDGSNLFRGIWTPITSETLIGADWTDGTSGQENNGGGASRTVSAGEFYFATEFETSANNINSDSLNVTQSLSNQAIDGAYNSTITDDSIASATLAARVQSLFDASDATTSTNPLIGMRFYNSANPVNGSRYNTIMNPNWRWEQFSQNTLNTVGPFTLHDTSGAVDSSNLNFEFDNSIGNTKGSKVGTANTTLTSDKYAATVTFYDGSSDIDVSGKSSIFSGLRGNGTIGLGDGRTYTFNAYDSNTSVFSGEIVKQGGGSTDAEVIKSGQGTLELSGDLEVEGSNAILVIYDGTLKLNPSSADTQIVESIGTVSGGTPVLELDNSGVGGNEIVEIGLANSTTPKEYSGAITLSGTNGTVNKITVGSADQQSKEQIFSGAITGTNDLVKDGSARLRISGDSTSTFSGDVIVEDGTLVVGNGSTDGSNLDSDNKITINKGKLEVAKNETLGVTVEGGTGKSMIGGGGTIGTVNLGAVVSTDIDYISPGRGISSSLSPSKKQVNFDANESTSIDTLTVNTLNWNDGGVFDWQIKDFDPSGGTEGEDWDFLSITSLNFESGKTFDINLMAISSTDGTQGAPDNLANTWTSGNYDQTNGFWFMSAGTVTGMGTGDVTDSFNIRTEDFSYSANNWMGNWGVWRDGGDFYLTYSAVPEPSTYMMVTGLLMVPGMSYVRRYRNKKKGIEVGEDNQSS